MKKECNIQYNATAEMRKFQRDFFRRAGHNAELLRDMFEQVPNAGFYIKDIDGRIVAGNSRSLEYSSPCPLSKGIGKKSNDLFAQDLANPVIEGDRWVAKHGRPLSIKALSPDRYRMNSISIFPVKDAKGCIIGTAGCYHRLGDPETNMSSVDVAIESAVAAIHRDFAEHLPIRKLAKSVGLSCATFLRHFTETMKMPPGQYILSTRINKACLILETSDSLISDIAAQVGFCDQSHFIRTFKKIRGTTPSKYRRQHRAIGT